MGVDKIISGPHRSQFILRSCAWDGALNDHDKSSWSTSSELLELNEKQHLIGSISISFT